MSQSQEADVTELDEGELPKSKVLDHLGLVAGMFEELEIGEGNLRFPESTSTSPRTLRSARFQLARR